MAGLLYTDQHVVALVENYLQAEPTDHMLGCQVRILFGLRAKELAGLGVVELPDPSYDIDHYDPRD